MSHKKDAPGITTLRENGILKTDTESLGMANEPRCEKTGPRGFPTRSDTNRAVQPQKMAGGLKFWMYEVEGLYYPCSENKGADQLRGYREADLRLCFCI